MRVTLIIAIVFLASAPALAALPSVSITAAPGINTSIAVSLADTDGDLSNATLYIIDKETELVVWTDYESAEGSADSIDFSWPDAIWRATNGLNSVEPVLVGITHMPESPSTAYSAPSILLYFPSGEEVIALAYFDARGGLSLLTDLQDTAFYRSKELYEEVRPEGFYPRYIKENVSILAGEGSLQFFKRFSNGTTELHPPLILARSPIHGYGLRLDRVPVDPRQFYVEVVAMDRLGGEGLGRADLGPPPRRMSTILTPSVTDRPMP